MSDASAFYAHINDKHLDPHPQYPLATEATAEISAAVTAGVAAHAALADPHTGYRLESVLIARSDMAADQRESTVTARVTPSTTRSTSSGTAVDWPVTDTLSLTITKEGGTTSDLVVQLFGSAYHTGGVASMTFGVRVNSTDYMNGYFYFNAANTHQSVVGYERITGLAAGSWTVTMRAYTSSASLTVNTDDRWQMIVREVPA